MRPLHLLPPPFHGSANATGNRPPYVAPAHVVTDWSESSPLSDSRVYALCFQHTDSIAFLSHCAYMGESGQYWFGEWMHSVGMGIYGEFIYQCLFQWLPQVLQIPDDKIHLQNWIQWFMDSWIWLRIIDSVFVRRTKVHPSFHYSMPFCSTNSVNIVFTTKITRFYIKGTQMIDIFNRRTKCGTLDNSCMQKRNLQKNHTLDIKVHSA